MHSPTAPVHPARGSERAGSAPGQEPSAGTWHRLWRRPQVEGRSLALARPRRLRQAGRATLLWAVGLYAVVQVVLVLVVDRWHPELHETARHKKWQQLRQLKAAAPDQPLLVMLGSSRTEQAFQAAWLNNLPGPDGKPFVAYNFGLPATGPLREGLYLREMLDAGIRPNLLLVEFLPPLLGAPRRGITSEENWTLPGYLHLSQLCRLWPYFAKPGYMGRAWLESRLAPAFAFRANFHIQLQERLFPGTTQILKCPHDERGWLLPLTFSPQECAQRLVNCHHMYHAGLSQFQMGAGPSQAMRDLVALCRQERIPLVLVLMPESTLFRSWYSAEGREAPRRLLEELRQTHGVPVIDATEWLDDWDFVDGHHVQGRGSWLFTARLRDELGQLLAGTGRAEEP